MRLRQRDRESEEKDEEILQYAFFDIHYIGYFCVRRMEEKSDTDAPL